MNEEGTKGGNEKLLKKNDIMRIWDSKKRKKVRQKRRIWGKE